MLFKNYASGQSYKVAVQLDTHDFNHDYESLYLDRFKDKTQFLFLAFNKEKTLSGQEHVLSKLPKGTLIVLSSAELFKHCTGERTLPKVQGRIVSKGDYHYQYMAYNQKALYLQKSLIVIEDCSEVVKHYLTTGETDQRIVTRKKFYPSNYKEAVKAFKYLLKQPVLGADIETTSLKFYEADLVSIAFAPDEFHGITFHVKKCDFEKLLVKFFKLYQGRIVWHGGSYDLKVLAYLYFDCDSRELFRTYEDSSIIHYMCTNSPERFERDLGRLGAPLCGEYKLTKAEITNMMNVDVGKVCDYNLDDSRATVWLYKNWYPKIHSEYLYNKFKYWQWSLVQIELNGMPFSMRRKVEVDKQITSLVKVSMSELMQMPEVQEAAYILRLEAMEKYNSTHVKQKNEEDFELSFNPNSNNQMAILLYDVIGLKCEEYTATKLRSASSKTIKKLRAQANDLDNAEHVNKIFDYADEFAKAGKIKSTFLKALDNHSRCVDGQYYLHGSFNLAKVVSGRLSSSEP